MSVGELGLCAVLTFVSEDLVLYLAAQGEHGQWNDLGRLCDLTDLMRRHPDLDWEAVLEVARRAAERLGGGAPGDVQRMLFQVRVQKRSGWGTGCGWRGG